MTRHKPHQRCGGLFTADPDVPADPLDRTGLRYCVCGLRGQAGDAHHPLPEPIEDGQMRAAGEHEES